MTIVTIGVLVVLSLTLLYRGRAYWAWLIPGGLALVGWWLDGVSSPTLFRVVVGVFAGLAVVFGVPRRWPSRRRSGTPCAPDGSTRPRATYCSIGP